MLLPTWSGSRVPLTPRNLVFVALGWLRSLATAERRQAARDVRAGLVPPCDCVGGCIAEIAGVTLDACRRQRRESSPAPTVLKAIADAGAILFLLAIVYLALVTFGGRN